VYTNPIPKYDEARFVPAQIKAGISVYRSNFWLGFCKKKIIVIYVIKGDAIVIDGLVVHKSLPNNSAKSRHIYTFHVYEAHETTYSHDNWLKLYFFLVWKKSD
jgi:hypothetical protein